MSHRGRVAAALAGLLLVGCGTTLPSPSSPSTPSSIPRRSPMASPAATQTSGVEPGVPGLTPHSTVVVSTGTLEIHSGPGTDYPVLLPAEWERTASGTKVSTHQGLESGDLLGLEGGALMADGQRWYLVTPFARDSRYDAWVDPQDPEVGLDGWVPAVGTDLPRLIQEDVVNPPALALYGIGAADITDVPVLDQAGLIWYAAAPSPRQDCHFKMTLPATGEVLVEEHVRGWGKGSAIWPDTAAEAQIDTTCAWAFDILEGVQ